MSVLNAFLSTWSNARQTFGEGTPATGEQYDNSAALRAMKSTVESAAPGSKWTGGAANAYGAANTEHARVFEQLAGLDQRLASHVGESAQVVAAGRRDLESVRKWVVDAAASTPHGQAGEQMRLAIVQKGIAQVQDIVQRSNGELNTIGGKIRGLDPEYQALGNQKFAKEGPVLGVGVDNDDEDEKKSHDEVGNEDSEALQNGQLTPEQHQRLVENTTLTPDQQTALDNGTLTLPPEQMSYLQGFSRAFGDKTPAEIKAVMEKAGPDGGRVADVFQLASNPAVGGKAALPDGIQKVLDGPVLTPLGYGEPTHNPDGSIGLPELKTASTPVAGLNDLADVIQRGNRDLQVGSALDSGMFEKSRQLLEQSNGWPVPGNDPMADRPRWYHQVVDPTLQNMFNAVNSDDMVIHDAVTGSGGEKFLNNLTQHQWQDDGLAAGGLFDWVGDSAAHDSTGRATETAHTLAEYTSSHSNQLLNLPDTQGQSLGQVNPELTRDWARAFSPYMDDMVGMNTGDSNGLFAPLDPDGGNLEPVNTRHLMSVLASDHPPLDQAVDANVPKTASQIAMESSQSHMNKMFDMAAHSVTDGTPGEDNYAMKAAGKLQAAMDLGSYDERFDATHDAATAAHESYELRSRLWDLGKDVVGELPGGSAAGGVANLGKEFFIGSEPVMPGVDNVHARDMFPVHMHMAAALVTAGAGDPYLRAQIEPYLANGEFKPPIQGGGGTYATFYSDLTSYLTTVGHDNVLNTMTDEYWRAYSGAITNAGPPK
ncbi:EspA/EspE family type VII secretion system effector [Mycobacterium sp. NPDC048908]|uniref:TPR repeat region-containing protein n=1 Tax=Mycobacterium sp. NPDC048908 TaxID=3364292 RepID=UPI003722B719